MKEEIMKKVDYIGNMEEWIQSFTFSINVNVRFSETDAFGHLNNTVPFTYFEDARIALLKSFGYEINQDSDIVPVVADLQCDFLRQVFFNEQLTLFTKVHSIGNTSMDIHYMAKHKEDICFVGRGTIVFISKMNGKSVPINGDLKKRLFVG
jgi:acyl-CoA thioester hydrolase